MEADHTEDMKRHRLARMRFKGLVHLVIANKFWLQDIEEQVGLNYQRNVAIITRRTRKKGILSLQEKKIIKKNHEERTLEEKRKLASVLAHLKCLERFSPKARVRLTPYIGYLYYGPKRTIHREGSLAMAMYCILDGEVTLMKKKWDYMQKKYVESVISILGSGDTFGEVSLLDNVTMPVTVKTASDVELLVLEGDYFYDTIGPEMKIEYDQKIMALKSIEYAKNWDSTQIFLACKLSTINQYPALETIYAEDQGLLNPVYFVISGQCTILQCLKVKVKIVNGHKTYRLFEEETDDFIEKQQRQQQQRATSVYELFQHEKDKKLKEEQEKQLSDLQKEKEIDAIEDEAFKKTNAEADRGEDHRHLLEIQKEMHIERLKKPGEKDTTVINYCGVHIDLTPMDVGGADPIMESSHSLPLQKETSMMRTVEEYKAEYEKAIEDFDDNIEKVEEQKRESSDKDQQEDDSSISTTSSKQESNDDKSLLNEDAASQEDNTVQKPVVIQYSVPSKTNLKMKSEMLVQKDFAEPRGTVHFKSSQEKTEFKKEHFEQVESHFVDVGTIAAGSIFGVGENMQHRAIMAKTTVQCIQIPRYWLFEKKQNPGNIWQRLQFHLNTTIPSREALFKDFLATRKWDKHKKKVVDSVTHDKKANNATKIDDIPIICRILEGMYD